MKKSHRVAHENQRRGGFCYYHYTTFIVTVKIPFFKKNTSSQYFLQYTPVTQSVTGVYCIVNYL